MARNKAFSSDTPRRILDAALRDFARYGYGGGRINRIARVANANKQLIYYYFGGKRGLYEAVVNGAYRDVAEAEKGVPPDLEGDLLYWLDFHLKHPDFIRLMEWEDCGPRSRPGKAAREIWRASLGRIRRNRNRLPWPKGLALDQFLITCIAINAWPAVFPHVCRQITGMDPSSPRFARERRKFVKRFARLLVARRGWGGPRP